MLQTLRLLGNLCVLVLLNYALPRRYQHCYTISLIFYSFAEQQQVILFCALVPPRFASSKVKQSTVDQL